MQPSFSLLERLNEVRMNRREREKQRHYEEILDVAENLFSEKGYDGTTVDDIAKSSEFSRRTIYTYFKSKDELYLAVYLRYTKIKLEMLSKAMDEAKTGYDKLLAFGEQYYRFFEIYPHFLRFQLYLDMQEPTFEAIPEVTLEETERQNQIGCDLITNAIVLGQQDGTIREGVQVDVFISHLFTSLRSILNISLRMTTKHFLFIEGIITPKEYFNTFLDRLLQTIKKQHTFLSGSPKDNKAHKMFR